MQSLKSGYKYKLFYRKKVDKKIISLFIVTL